MIFLDANNNIIYEIGFDFNDKPKITTVDKNWKEHVMHKLSDIKISELPFTGSAGYIVHEQKIYLTSIYPIVDTNKKNPPNGFLIWGRHLDQKELANLNTKLEYHVNFNSIPIANFDHTDLNLSKLENGDGLYRFSNIDDNNSRLELLMKDFDSRHYIQLVQVAKREFFKMGREINLESGVRLIILGIVFSLLSLFLMNRLIISKITNVIKQVTAIKSFAQAKTIEISTNDEFKDLVESINQLLHQLKDNQQNLIVASKNSILIEMSAGVAHEINNPLTIIIGKTKFLQKEIQKTQVNKEKLVDDLKKIEQMSTRISQITKGLLIFSGDSGSKIKTTCKISKIIESTLFLGQEKIKTLAIQLKIAEIPNVSIFCVESDVIQALYSLITNATEAVEFSTEKWIELDFKTIDDNKISIRVTDSGPGISADIATKIMNPFFTTKQTGKGPGLGLSIAKGIVEQYGGQLRYDHLSPRTQFTIELPLEKAESLSTKTLPHKTIANAS